jgi:hypothetical protein
MVFERIKRGLFRHGQPTAHLVGINEKFAAFFRQIAPFVPVLPTNPANKSFAVNKTRTQCYLDTVEVRSSSLLVPTIPFSGLAAAALQRLLDISIHNSTGTFPIHGIEGTAVRLPTKVAGRPGGRAILDARASFKCGW